MRKAVMIASLMAFAAAAAYAAPRNSDVPAAPTNDEVVILPIDDTVSDSDQKAVRSLAHAGTNCGCDKPKKGKN